MSGTANWRTTVVNPHENRRRRDRLLATFSLSAASSSPSRLRSFGEGQRANRSRERNSCASFVLHDAIECMTQDTRQNETPSEPENSMARQLVLYADSIAAFAFIQSVALGYALWGKDLSSNIAKWTPSILCGVLGLELLVSLFYLVILFGCHAGEDSLLGKPRERGKVGKWTARVRYVRIATVIFAAGMMSLAFLFTWLTVRGSTSPAPAEKKSMTLRIL
jgi:hypothetical protein